MKRERERDKDLMEECRTKTIRRKRPKTGQFKCRRSPVNSYAPAYHSAAPGSNLNFAQHQC